MRSRCTSMTSRRRAEQKVAAQPYLEDNNFGSSPIKSAARDRAAFAMRPDISSTQFLPRPTWENPRVHLLDDVWLLTILADSGRHRHPSLSGRFERADRRRELGTARARRDSRRLYRARASDARTRPMAQHGADALERRRRDHASASSGCMWAGRKIRCSSSSSCFPCSAQFSSRAGIRF